MNFVMTTDRSRILLYCSLLVATALVLGANAPVLGAAAERAELPVVNLQNSLDTMLDSITDSFTRWVRAVPLVLASLFVFLFVAFAGHQLAKRSGMWSRLTANPFLAQIIAQSVRVAGILLGLLLALNMLGATALMGTILGSAGVVGLAISFGVKDSIENYIASIMLSIRQPFRAQDHIVIGDQEGIVVRLTSRSTLLMTLDGNHLRIPNATVYKSAILNYTRNPQRRFDFVLGVDAEDDPADAMSVGVAVLQGLDWVLDEPSPHAIIETVGDSNILVRFMGWIDQRYSDFGKSRSLSIRATKNALEEKGFTLPEPIYRLRFDDSVDLTPESIQTIRNEVQRRRKSDLAKDEKTEAGGETASIPAAPDDLVDVEPETHVSEQARQERSQSTEDDLLDASRPIE